MSPGFSFFLLKVFHGSFKPDIPERSTMTFEHVSYNKHVAIYSSLLSLNDKWNEHDSLAH